MAETVEELTPLKKKLDDFGTFLSKVCAYVGPLAHMLSHAIASPVLQPADIRYARRLQKLPRPAEVWCLCRSSQ